MRGSLHSPACDIHRGSPGSGKSGEGYACPGPRGIAVTLIALGILHMNETNGVRQRKYWPDLIKYIEFPPWCILRLREVSASVSIQDVGPLVTKASREDLEVPDT